MGGIMGGVISNRVGVKRVVITSTLLALLPLYTIFFMIPGSLSYFVTVALAGILINAGMPLLIVSAQDLSPKNAAAASGMLMGFSAGAAGLAYVGIGRLQEVIGLTPAMSIGYLALIAAAALASLAIKPQRPSTQPQPAPVEGLSCICSPCLDQNIAVIPQRTTTLSM
jgi:FSR family fosmidomycin resistance protein-like MFS transporter